MVVNGAGSGGAITNYSINNHVTPKSKGAIGAYGLLANSHLIFLVTLYDSFH